MRYLLAFVLFFSPVLKAADAPVQLVLWHAFDGFLEEQFKKIVEDFNFQSGTYFVVPVRKGNYKEVYERGLSAYLDGKPPHILHIYEVATSSAMQTPNFFWPVDDLMRSFHRSFDPDVYIDAVRTFYCCPNGKMLSLPWNASTGALFYNKKAFAEAGLDPNAPPKTWEEIETFSLKLAAKGYTGFTTAWPAAYHLEHFSSCHNLPYATKSNGFAGPDARLIFNQSAEVLHHITQVAKWQKMGLFQYMGRYNEDPEEFFSSGKCAILLQGANRLPILKKKADFEIGVGQMPYYAKFTDAPYALNIGGGSFWVFNGFSDREYRGIVQFFSYLSSTEVQAGWHQKTGYLPITEAAYYLTRKKGFYATHPAVEIPVLEVLTKRHTPNTRGVRLGNYTQVRDVIIDNLEKAFSGELAPQEALDIAAAEGNKLLEAFEAGVR